MSTEHEPEPGERELEAANETAASDAIDASAEPPSTPTPKPAAELVIEFDAEASGISAEDAGDHRPEAAEHEDDEEPAAPEPPAKLERLQKILAQAGIASRRHAEELITSGRVQVNGQVVTTLGTKANPARDHIRVDGKLLHGAERLRYFVLNKPKGYVTTASDPEGRPTVMEFFAKLPERLYPVGRLDYQSEGLLLVTNDGELANKLTRAASGVEKTYLVKVSGQPTEEELEALRGGVTIDREQPGSGKVHTAPAQVRQVRQGENPWFEVVLIEGRNRELRKMFQEIGHFVEKIRRVGYGPLVLDVEPGKLRELDEAELDALRKTADGKLKPRRLPVEKHIPKEAGRGARPARRDARSEGSERRGGPDADRRGPGGRPPQRDAWRERPGSAKPRFEKPGFAKSGFAKSGPAKSGFAKSGFAGKPKFGERPPRKEFGQREDRPRRFEGQRPERAQGSGPGGPASRPASGPGRGPGQGPDRGPARGFSERRFESRPPRREFDRPKGKPFRPRPDGTKAGEFKTGEFKTGEKREFRPRAQGAVRVRPVLNGAPDRDPGNPLHWMPLLPPPASLGQLEAQAEAVASD